MESVPGSNQVDFELYGRIRVKSSHAPRFDLQESLPARAFAVGGSC